MGILSPSHTLGHFHDGAIAAVCAHRINAVSNGLAGKTGPVAAFFGD